MATQFCRDDARCGAGVNLDGRLWGNVVDDGLQRPMMFLLSDHGEASDPISREITTDIRRAYHQQPIETRLLLSVRGAHHFTFSDHLLRRSLLISTALRLTGMLDIGARRGLAVTTAAVRRFLDLQLKGAPRQLLEELSTGYPELFQPAWLTR